MHGTGTRVQAFIGDPVSDAPVIEYDRLEEQADESEEERKWDPRRPISPAMARSGATPA
jgi:hypothetical protein